jgi:CubicO group peptidase (beta-lactamase class C family)
MLTDAFTLQSLDHVDELLEAYAVPAASVAVIEDGELVLERAWGIGHTELHDPVTPRTMFQAGSISKAVFCFGALRLVEQGLIDLDGDVQEVLRGWSVPTVEGWRPRITPRMLMSHLAGLSVHGFPGYRWNEMPSLDDVLGGNGNTPPVVPEALPGLLWKYSGGGTTVLQKAMIDISGEDTASLMRRLVLDPAGMRESTYEQPLPQCYNQIAASAHTEAGPWPSRWDAFPEMAAAGLWATASDLARFCLAVVHAHLGRPDALLSQATVTELLTGQTRAEWMGLGPLLSTSGSLVFWHSGSQAAGFATNMACAADGSIGVIALTNSVSGMPVANEILRCVGSAHGVELPPAREWRNDVLQGLNDPAPVPDSDPAVPGRYTIGDLRIDVETAGEVLRIELDGQPPLDLNRKDGHWQASRLDTAARFDDGILVIHQYGRALRTTPVS